MKIFKRHFFNDLFFSNNRISKPILSRKLYICGHTEMEILDGKEL
jgi:hypothetical protein